MAISVPTAASLPMAGIAAALISAMAPRMDIVAAIIIAAEDDHIRHWRSDHHRAAVIRADIPDATGNHDESNCRG